MNIEIIKQALIVFAVMFIADIAWALYISRVQEKNPLGAVFWAIMLFLAGAVGTISYVGNPWMLIPACMGVAFGTWLAITIEKRNK